MDEGKVREAVDRYVNAKIAMVLCKQKHMRQLCHRCHKYARCLVYGEYVDAWTWLQTFGSKKASSRDPEAEFDPLKGGMK